MARAGHGGTTVYVVYQKWLALPSLHEYMYDVRLLNVLPMYTV